jgi:putative transcriptional regulator
MTKSIYIKVTKAGRGEFLDIEEEFSKKIAGEIVLSSDPNKTLKKWRETFGLSKTELANKLNISISVVCDYEGGRRKSPGTKMVKKIISALIKSDTERGAPLLKYYERSMGKYESGAILDIKEFSSPLKASEICDIVKGTVVINEGLMEKKLYGYTALDSLTAILEMSSDEFLKVYGLSSERALVFTKVSSGRSPFVAIRVASIKPGLVVLHGLKSVDPLGLKIAEKEKIPVVLSSFENVSYLIEELGKNTG